MRITLLVLVSLLLSTTLLSAAPVPAIDDICEILKDSKRYASGSFSYSDFGSTFGVLSDNPWGVGTLLLDWNGGERVFSASLATLDVAVVNGEKEEDLIGLHKTFCYPHGILTQFHCRSADTTSFVTFISANTLACQFEITNRTESDMTLRPRLRGSVLDLAGSSREMMFDAQNNVLTLTSKEPKIDPSDTSETFRLYGTFRPSFLVEDARLGADSASLGRSWELRGSQSAAYSLSGPKFVIPPGKSAKLWAIIGFSIDDKSRLDSSMTKAVEAIKPYTVFEKTSRERWNTIFAKMPRPPDDADVKKLYYRSARALMGNVIESGGKFGKNRPCFAKRSRGVQTPSKAALIALGLSEIDKSLAQEQILILTENVDQSGAMPEAVTGGWISSKPCIDPPLVAIAAWRVYLRSRDKKFLGQVYGPLCKSTEWWFAGMDSDADGLVEQSGPDGQAYDSVELNAYLAVQMKTLARIALALEKRDEYRSWTDRADALKQKIGTTLYSPEDNFFYNATAGSHELLKESSPACFAPMWADVKLPGNKMHDMVWDGIFRDKTLSCGLPCRTVVSDGDKRITPRSVYILMDTLRNFRYDRNAKRIGDVLLSLVTDAGSNCEAFDAETGKGVGEIEDGVTASIVVESVLNRYGQN